LPFVYSHAKFGLILISTRLNLGPGIVFEYPFQTDHIQVIKSFSVTICENETKFVLFPKKGGMS